MKYFIVISSYQDKLCGLCGNYDGDTKDDFRKPDGSLANNANDFGHSWNTDPELVLFIVFLQCTHIQYNAYKAHLSIFVCFSLFFFLNTHT